MQIKAKNSNIEIGFSMPLTIIFIILKLFGIINWSWWWVLCPMWIPIVIALSIYAVSIFVALMVLLIMMIASIYEKIQHTRS